MIRSGVAAVLWRVSENRVEKPCFYEAMWTLCR